jgi:hypothetical protein
MMQGQQELGSGLLASVSLSGTFNKSVGSLPSLPRPSCLPLGHGLWMERNQLWGIQVFFSASQAGMMALFYLMERF